MFDKRKLFESLCERLAAMIKGAAEARMVSEAESRSHKGAMSSRYDTFKEEAQALAGGQGKREMDLTRDLSRLQVLMNDHRIFLPAEKVRVGAIVRVKDLDKNEEAWYLNVNAGGGLEIEAEGVKLKSLNLSTPLGQSLFKREDGDQAEFEIEGRVRRLEILEIQ